MALYYKSTFNVQFHSKYIFLTKTSFTAKFPKRKVQSVTGVASENIIIITNNITNMSSSQISQLISPSAKIGDRSISETGSGNELTREVLNNNNNTRNFVEEIGISVDGIRRRGDDSV
ncbi:hypothetical protein BPOR_1792g00010 [Botrytis porri]|uniref:Uncharacterized protein n=1 Tax=Botrytis porri TaxID=87229 RepID=A0A4Z1K860_9HELO|nr:hypothetical protein BPOR_1792g00010 [Botrytis porri]